MKPTQKELQERIDLVIQMLAQGRRKGEICRRVKETYGVSTRTVETYLSRARDQMRESAQPDYAEAFQDAVEFYQGILQGDAPIQAKIRARERLDKLFGLESPQRHEVAEKCEPIFARGPDRPLSDEVVSLMAELDLAMWKDEKRNRTGSPPAPGAIDRMADRKPESPDGVSGTDGESEKKEQKSTFTG